MKNMSPITATDTVPHELARTAVPVGKSTWEANIMVDYVEPQGWSVTAAAIGARVTVERTGGGIRIVAPAASEPALASCLFEACDDGVRLLVKSEGGSYRFHLVWLRQLSADGEPILTYGDAELLGGEEQNGASA